MSALEQTMSILERLRRTVLDVLIDQVPGPPEVDITPDPDGRRDTGDLDYDPAVPHVELQPHGSGGGSGGTLVSGPRDEIGPPP
jgi:hypothetical protein